jgi:hypothetical protein
MTWGFVNLGMLFGLAALALPVLVHLLRRRRHDAIAWGAMQFLPTGVATRHRRFWDELPLMALRLGLIAVLVLALAGPYSSRAIFAPLSERPARDLVIVLDGSYRMDRRDEHGRTPWQEACRRATEHIAQLGRSERAALVVARRPPLAWQESLTSDCGLLQARVNALPPPRGNAGLPLALAEAWRLLQPSEAERQEIVLLTDRQHCGWADDATRRQWEAVSRQLRGEADKRRAMPRLQAIDVAKDLGPSRPNFALGPLAMARGLVPVGQGVKFTSVLHRGGPAAGVRRIRVTVDGEPAQDVPLPEKLDAPQVPLTFTQRFDRPGQRVVTLTLEVDDALPVDNQQHAIVEAVAELPVLLVDGERTPSAESSTFYLDKALAGAGKQSVVVPRIVPFAELTAAHLLGASRPRVVILADVPELPGAAQEALDTYLKEGGGVLVALGPRAGQQRWMPAKLARVAGESGAPARPDLASFQHPALELFRKAPGGGLGEVAFPRWHKLSTDGAVGARLTSGDPLLVEKAYGKGRVMVCSVPLDRSWESPLPSTWEFPVLVHELIYYLAGARAQEWSLQDGQPLRVGGTAPERLIVQTPEVASRTVQVRDWPWTDADTGAIGLYQVLREDGSRQSFVVPPDLRESEDRRCTDQEWMSVLGMLPMEAADEEGDFRHELWWLFIVGVMGLLCGEVFLTRQLARSHSRSLARASG